MTAPDAIICEVCKVRAAVGNLALQDAKTGKVDNDGMGPNVCEPCGTEITGSELPYED